MTCENGSIVRSHDPRIVAGDEFTSMYTGVRAPLECMPNISPGRIEKFSGSGK